MGAKISLVGLPKLSAIYYGLLKCGYDSYAFEKQTDLVEQIERFRAVRADCDYSFFNGVRQKTCAVYPYWPRAAALETASFFISSGEWQSEPYNAYKRDIMSAPNLTDEERDQSFWTWVKAFPAALKGVLSSASFRDYLAWENAWITRQNHTFEEDLRDMQDILSRLETEYATQVRPILLALIPIKCAYSADYHISEGALVVCSGAFSVASVVHETLHPIVHSHMSKQREAVLAHGAYPGIDASYYLSGNERGKLNAFEEYVVRKLTMRILASDYPSCLEAYIGRLAHAK